MKEKPDIRVGFGVHQCFRALRIHQHGERRKPIQLALREQGMQDGGGDVRATSDGLGEDHVRRVCQHRFELRPQIGEAAAETARRHLPARHVVQLRKLRVDQCIALVVEDGGAAHSASLQLARGGEDQRGLARAEEAADED